MSMSLFNGLEIRATERRVGLLVAHALHPLSTDVYEDEFELPLVHSFPRLHLDHGPVGVHCIVSQVCGI